MDFRGPSSTSYWQTPPEHTPLVHTWPHEPQLLGFVWRSAQKQMVAQQSALGDWHTQLPLEQTSVGRHRCPQLPQFWRSVDVSTQKPPQSALGDGHPPPHGCPVHASVHEVAWHSSVGAPFSAQFWTPSFCKLAQSLTEGAPHVWVDVKVKLPQ